jgi:hypothetical protein
MERSEYAEAAEKNAQRVRKHPSIYSARQQIIEHVFGTIKRQWGYDHILLKGLRKNDGMPSPEASAPEREFGLIYLVYNFRRIINILGVEGVQKWVKKTLFRFFHAVILRSAYWWNEKEFFSTSTGYAIQWNRNFGKSYCTN